MGNSSDAEKFKVFEVCSWCGAHFQIASTRAKPVCLRCYRLLSTAGLTDEEIYADASPDEDVKKD